MSARNPTVMSYLLVAVWYINGAINDPISLLPHIIGVNIEIPPQLLQTEQNRSPPLLKFHHYMNPQRQSRNSAVLRSRINRVCQNQMINITAPSRVFEMTELPSSSFPTRNDRASKLELPNSHFLLQTAPHKNQTADCSLSISPVRLIPFTINSPNHFLIHLSMCDLLFRMIFFVELQVKVVPDIVESQSTTLQQEETNSTQ